jgi:hypothetical protein
MTGNDLQMAISLFYEDNPEIITVEEKSYPDYQSIFWGKGEIPPAWTKQGFTFHKLGFE